MSQRYSKGQKKKRKKPHPNPDQHSGEKHSGDNMDIRGHVEISRSPSLEQQHAAEREEDTGQHNKAHTIQVLTFIAVVIGAGLTGIYVILTYCLLNTAQKTYNVSQRPYVGIATADGTHYSKNAAGEFVKSDKRTKETTNFAFSTEVKNFGVAPARNAIISWVVTVGGVPLKPSGVPDTPISIFPGGTFNLLSFIDGDNYTNVMNGTKTLGADIHVKYDGPTETYQECFREQYNSDAGSLMNLGACP